MELLQLKYFKALAENEHLINTAKEMYVTPSAISSSLSRLENELQVKLFDRVGRNIKLNDNGKIFLKYVNQVFNALYNAQNELQKNNLIEPDTISLGLLTPILWKEALYNFQVKYSEIKLKQITCDITIDSDPKILDKLDHVIAGPDAIADDDWDSFKMFDDYLVLAVQNDHPFARRTSVDLREAENEKFIGSTSQNSFKEGCHKLFESLGMTPKYIGEFDYTIRPKMLDLGQGIILTNILSSIVLCDLYGDNVTFVKVENEDHFLGKYLYWRKSCSDVDISIKFRSFIKSYDWGLS